MNPTPMGASAPSQAMDERMATPLMIFASSFGLASCAGLAALLRSGRALTPLQVASAMLNSGLLGLGLALLWYERFRDNIYALVGMTVLAGMGGASFVDLALTLIHTSLVRTMAPQTDRTPPPRGGGPPAGAGDRDQSGGTGR